MEDTVLDRSGLDALNRKLAGNGTRRRTLLVGGLLGALGLARGADATPKTPKKKRKKAATPKMLWAVVNSGGDLALGSGVTSTRKLQGNGRYEVVFDRDVSTCAHIAHLPYFFAFGDAYVTTGTTNVTVFTYDTSQSRISADKTFHLMVMC